MAINYLGNPSADEIADLQTYLGQKLAQLTRLTVAKQNEIDSLRATITNFQEAEAALASQINLTVNDFALSNYIKAPVISVEDQSFLENQLYQGTATANVVDTATLPFRDVIKRELETIDYKIRKLRYLVEFKQKELSILNDALTNQSLTDG